MSNIWDYNRILLPVKRYLGTSRELLGCCFGAGMDIVLVGRHLTHLTLTDILSSVRSLDLSKNELKEISAVFSKLKRLERLDISENQIAFLSSEMKCLKFLKTLIIKKNNIKSVALDFGMSQSIEKLNLAGNRLPEIPIQFTMLTRLVHLNLGSNQIVAIPKIISNLMSLEYLYLGGNKLVCLPQEMGFLPRLSALYLHNNQLINIPANFRHLRSLRTLTLHNNNLSSLPRGFLSLKHLESLTIRQNPLVQDFVRKLPVGPPSLQEVAGRVIKNNDIYYSPEILPQPLVDYLDSAKRCVNPQCNHVYFDTRVQDVEFVDFCGLYRVPLHHYICSPHPIEHNSSPQSPSDRMRRVLLG
ncbi:hypothetical protein ACHWQZ_G001040 [Mnemiopsis leidyi]